MRITIDDRDIDHAKVTYRELGFGQAIPGNTVRYRLEVSDAEFRAAIQRPFDEFVEENEIDDKETGGSEAIPELKQHAYPSFEEIYRASVGDLCNIVKEHLFFELLDGLLGGSEVSECQFAINSIETIACAENGIVLVGTAYSVN